LTLFIEIRSVYIKLGMIYLMNRLVRLKWLIGLLLLLLNLLSCLIIIVLFSLLIDIVTIIEYVDLPLLNVSLELYTNLQPLKIHLKL
jgi:hypothetical protein